MTRAPLVSVVMPVRNVAPYVDEAISGILHQSYTNFEFVILDDASTDDTWNRLSYWGAQDDRIRLHRSEVHTGPSVSSQAVASLARGRWIARQDGDDWSHPDRLQQQVAVFEQYPELVMVGTLYECIDPFGQVVRPRDRAKIFRRSYYNPFPHGSVMFSADAFRACGGYRRECAYWEDQDLFVRLARQGKTMVIMDSLYRMRLHGASGSNELNVAARQAGQRVAFRCLRHSWHGWSYEDILSQEQPEATGDSSWSYYAAHIPQFWSGHRPGLLWRLLRSCALPGSLPEAQIWVLALCAELHPAWTRAMLFQWIRWTDRVATRKLQGRMVVELPYPWNGPVLAA
jgi:glycosyltransferase involved in cell wall biosynthesis